MTATELVNKLIKDAIDRGASDIHIEAQKESMRVRFRVDGLLEDRESFDKILHPQAVSRIKIMANLDIAEQRLPQDGKVHIRHSEKEFDLRISSIPTVHGEKVTVRILKKNMALLPLDGLGMRMNDLQNFNELISKRSGMVIVTGPTGCGKTTTLYSTINKINSPELNIVTIEDPVEYELPGINQINVNIKAYLTFARALRSILRQDPDVIMVGEIRDEETARIAVQAAMTGHLVLTTMHTNDSVGAIARLSDLGIEPFLINASLSAVLAQRLVRLAAGGRTGIFELLRVSPKLKELVSRRASEEEIRHEAKAGGMNCLSEDREEKIRLGLIAKQAVPGVYG